jgi:hypothetical protein
VRLLLSYWAPSSLRHYRASLLLSLRLRRAHQTPIRLRTSKQVSRLDENQDRLLEKTSSGSSKT